MRYFRKAHTSTDSREPHSRGIALAVVLVIMTILTLMGVVLLIQTDSNMIGARNEKEVAICRQAAEAAVRKGLDLSSGYFDTTTHYFKGTILGCNGNTPYDGAFSCPTQAAPPVELASKYIVDKPGHTFEPTWAGRLFIDLGANNPGNVYVTIYARNNIDEVGAAVATDKDGRVTIVGEAMMTFDGLAPLPNKSNVRVRKMIAADIIQPRLTSGCGPDTHNQNSNYGC